MPLCLQEHFQPNGCSRSAVALQAQGSQQLADGWCYKTYAYNLPDQSSALAVHCAG